MLRRLFFNLWYFQKPPWDTGISPPELMAFIQEHPPGRALDLGCGTGTNAITLAQHGWQVSGVDFAWRAIRMARRKASQAGVRVDFQVGDVSRYKNSGEPFDLVLDIGCFHSLPAESKKSYARNLERLLSPTGTYLMYGFFRQPDSSGPGMAEADLDLLASHLSLAGRQDGFDRGQRASAWFTYRKK